MSDLFSDGARRTLPPPLQALNLARMQSPCPADAADESASAPSPPSCVVCTAPLSEGTPAHMLPCGHTFHCGCICEWFRRGFNSCPLCRDAPEAVDISWLDSRARARELQRLARRTNAPLALRRLVMRMREADQDLRRKQREARTFRRTYTGVFVRMRRMCRAVERAHFRKCSLERTLGTYHSFQYPLPPLVVRARREDEASSDSDEAEYT